MPRNPAKNAVVNDPDWVRRVSVQVQIHAEADDWDQVDKVIAAAKLDAQKNRKQIDPLELAIAELDLDRRTVNCLEQIGLIMVTDLLRCTEADLMQIPNFGDATLKRVFDALAKVGLHRKGGEYAPAAS